MEIGKWLQQFKEVFFRYDLFMHLLLITKDFETICNFIFVWERQKTGMDTV